MTLSLPEAVEPFLSEDYDWSQPAVYALKLNKPDELETEWDSEFDVRPPYFEQLQTASDVVYVGAASNLMHRLEDHRNGQKRKSALLRVCAISGLRNVWWFKSADRAFERESQFAMALQNQLGNAYVHQR